MTKVPFRPFQMQVKLIYRHILYICVWVPQIDQGMNPMYECLSLSYLPRTLFLLLFEIDFISEGCSGEDPFNN